MLGILAQMTWGQWSLAFLLILVCCFLMLVILLQRGRGSGLTGAFGGGGGSSAFGAKTGDVFTWITVVVASIFLLLNVFANYAFDQTPVRESRTPSEAASTETGGEGEPVDVKTIEIPPLPTGGTESGPGGSTSSTAPPSDTTPPTPGEGDSGAGSDSEGTGSREDGSSP